MEENKTPKNLLQVTPDEMLRPASELNKNAYDQPTLSAIMSHLNYEFSSFKYTVYRCASKFVTLQKVFYTCNIPYKLVLAVLERHNIKHADANYMVPPFQLTSIIHDIYFACERLGHFTKLPSYNLDTATSVLSNFFWNIFDPHRRHSISLIEIKVTFLLLCKLYSSDQLVTEFFYLVCDPKNNCVSKFSFEYLLNILSKTLTYIGEGGAYGSHNIPVVMEQCYARCHNFNGFNESKFLCLWSTTQTRFLIYANLIALIKRIEDTEKLVHNNACTSCRSEKIVGIRFKCQTCKNVSLCLKCFATGFSSNKHESGHRMFEVFTEDLPSRKFSHYFAKLCNIFFQKNTEERRGLCNANDSSVVNETELVTIETSRSDAATNMLSSNLRFNSKEFSKHEQTFMGLSVSSSSAANASERLQSIIERLLQQNAKIEKQLKCIQTASTTEISSFLSAHQNFLIGIINEMRTFSEIFHCASYPTSSTPNRSIFAKRIASNGVSNGNLSQSVNGADINRSYLDANKSDYSISDLSSLFNKNKMSVPFSGQTLSVLAENARDTEMTSFKLLLNKVKEIVEDSYSDNKELAVATQNLENALDSIIKGEESRRKSS